MRECQYKRIDVNARAITDAIDRFTSTVSEGWPRISRGSTPFSTPAYAEPGVLLFEQDGLLLAQRFDPDAGVLRGAPTTISARMLSSGVGNTSATLSDNGVLVYREHSDFVLELLDRKGRELSSSTPIRQMGGGISLSPDESRVVYQHADPGTGTGMDIWILDLVRGTSSRWTSSRGWDSQAIWSPDGRRIAYGSEGTILVRDVGAEESAGEVVLEMDEVAPVDWSRDGRYLIVENVGATGIDDIWALDLYEAGEPNPLPLATTAFEENDPRLSPDGRFLAFASNESGRFEIYVKPFLRPGTVQKISIDGGFSPRWRPEGNEIFYLSPRNEIVGVRFTPDGESGTLALAPAEALFATPGYVSWASRGNWDALPGDRFAVLAPEDPASRDRIHVINNWTALLPEEP